MELSIPMLAGSLSTAIFAISTLPMLIKACRSKDMRSYSLGNLILANIGNAVHSVYVFSLPTGPVWALHSFYLISSLLMLVWYLRCEPSRGSSKLRSFLSISPRRTTADRVAPSTH